MRLVIVALLLLPYVAFGWGEGLADEIDLLLEMWFELYERTYIDSMVIAHLEEGEDDRWDLDVDRPANYYVYAVCDKHCADN